MARPIIHDRDQIHRQLFERADRRGKIEVQQKLLAAELGISQFHFNRIIQSFLAAGRLRVIGGNRRRGSQKAYIVTPPDEYQDHSGHEESSSPSSPSSVDGERPTIVVEDIDPHPGSLTR